MARMRPMLKYLSCFALLLLMLPLVGGWKPCNKKAGKEGIIPIAQSIIKAELDSSISSTEDSIRGASKCACKKGKSCPGIPRVFLASLRNVSRAEQLAKKNSVHCFSLGYPRTSVSANSPPCAFNATDFRKGKSVRAEILLTTVLII